MRVTVQKGTTGYAVYAEWTYRGREYERYDYAKKREAAVLRLARVLSVTPGELRRAAKRIEGK